eukprot:Amastigsp_a179702_96.p3 type:complete len:119 gc:universal Amastigsp_a179702_96:142-498(+)
MMPRRPQSALELAGSVLGTEGQARRAICQNPRLQIGELPRRELVSLAPLGCVEDLERGALEILPAFARPLVGNDRVGLPVRDKKRGGGIGDRDAAGIRGAVDEVAGERHDRAELVGTA